MKIIYMGNNKRGVACLNALNESHHEILLSIGQTGSNGWYTSIKEEANKLGIDYVHSDNPNNSRLISRLSSLNPDVIVMCGYSKIVGKKIRKIPGKGCINCHAGKLPEYRGAAPLNWAMINGEEEIGLSIYFVDGGIDTGPIIKQEIINVQLTDTIRDILEKTLRIYPKMLLEVLEDLENESFNSISQDPNQGFQYTKRYPRDGLIDWEQMTDVKIYNLVRALTHPYPGSFFYYNGKKVYVWNASLEKKNYFGIPGRVASRKGAGVVVIAKNRGVRILTVQPEGKDEIPADEFFTRNGMDLVLKYQKDAQKEFLKV